MNKNRLEGFSDGFFAVIITVMVLELKPPAGTDFASLAPLDPIFLSYLLSFVFMAIYWNNHNLLFQVVDKINSSVIWANFNFLFWLSLIPFSLSWIGKDGLSTSAVSLYGGVLFLTTFSFYLLIILLSRTHGKEWKFLKAVPNPVLGYISFGIFIFSIILSFYFPKLAFALYAIAVMVRLIPAHRIEKSLFQ